MPKQKGSSRQLILSLLIVFLAIVIPLVLSARGGVPGAPIGFGPTCGDGIDNDNDGLVDLADFGCDNRGDKTETSSLLICDNGIDDDNDGFIDLNDIDCSSHTDTSEIADSCADTDGGNNLPVAGSISGVYNNQPFNNADTCGLNSTITEYYCIGSMPASQVRTCLNGCTSGACL